MSNWLGFRPPASTVTCKFTTAINGIPATLGGSPVVSVYQSGNTTEVTTGVTLTADYDNRTGYNDLTIDMSTGNSFYIPGKEFSAVITTGTLNSQSVAGTEVCSWTVPGGSGAQDAPTDAVYLQIAQAGGASSITLDSGASATTDFYKGLSVAIIAGTGVGQAGRVITAYNGSTKVATVTPAWATNPGSTSVFMLLSAGADVETILGTASVGAAGYVGIDWGHVNAPASAVNLSATTVNLVNTTTTVTNQLTAAQIATGVWQDAVAGDFTTNLSIGKSLYTSGVVPGGSGGLFIAGSNAATTVNITGNLSGSVVSVTGAVGSVTGNVGGNVVGNVNGNVVGSIGSVGNVTNIVTGVWQDATAGDFTVASSIGKALYVNNVAPGGAGGHFIAGTNAPVTITGSGDALTLLSTGGGGHGFKITGDTTGDGIHVSGGGDGSGIYAEAGTGTGGYGIKALGRGTSKDGIHAEATGNAGHGINAISNAAGAGIRAQGDSNGIYASGGVSDGHAILAVAGGLGDGIHAIGGAANYAGGIVGIAGTGSNGQGFIGLGDGTGAGLYAKGGAAGAGIYAIGQGGEPDIDANNISAISEVAWAEPGQGAPPASATLIEKLGYLFKAWRNKSTQTASEYDLYNSAGNVVDQKAAVSDNGITFTRQNVVSGP